MASSGTIGNSRNAPYLTIYWEVVDTDIASNSSKVKATLRLHSPYFISFTSTKYGNLQGSSFSYARASGSGTWNLRTREFWVSHDSDGKKSLTISGNFNIKITYSGTWYGNLTVSGTANLNDIPRASRLTTFSAGNELKHGMGSYVVLGIERYYSGYKHEVVLKYGNYEVKAWGGENLPTALWFAPEGLLEKMKNVNEATLTLHINTKDYSTIPATQIGVSNTLTTTFKIAENDIPTIDSFNVSKSGRTIGDRYLQGYTQAKYSLGVTPTYGAVVSVLKVEIRNSKDEVIESLSTLSGTTAVFKNAEIYKIVAIVIDSRGRVGTQAQNIYITPYKPPSISLFEVERRQVLPTSISVLRTGNWTELGGDNPLTVEIDYRESRETTWSNQKRDTIVYGEGQSDTFQSTDIYWDYGLDKSFEIRITIRDILGNEVSIIRRVGTGKVVFDIHKNLGVGVGKRHELGDLDIANEAFIGGSEIVASGQNSNGTWVKFYSGLMICSKFVNYSSVPINTDSGGLYTSSYKQLGNWPKEFIETPIRFVDLRDAGGNYGFWLGSTASADVTSVVAGNVLFNYVKSFTMPYVALTVLGVGFWK